jgi:hypothetical protein
VVAALAAIIPVGTRGPKAVASVVRTAARGITRTLSG